MGEIVYVQDLPGGTAVFEMPGLRIWPGADAPARAYLSGLAGNGAARAVSEGVWAIPGGLECETPRALPDGRTASFWGLAVVTWNGPAFPTGFTIPLGVCDGGPARTIPPARAEPA